METFARGIVNGDARSLKLLSQVKQWMACRRQPVASAVPLLGIRERDPFVVVEVDSDSDDGDDMDISSNDDVVVPNIAVAGATAHYDDDDEDEDDESPRLPTLAELLAEDIDPALLPPPRPERVIINLLDDDDDGDDRPRPQPQYINLVSDDEESSSSSPRWTPASNEDVPAPTTDSMIVEQMVLDGAETRTEARARLLEDRRMEEASSSSSSMPSLKKSAKRRLTEAREHEGDESPGHKRRRVLATADLILNPMAPLTDDQIQRLLEAASDDPRFYALMEVIARVRPGSVIVIDDVEPATHMHYLQAIYATSSFSLLQLVKFPPLPEAMITQHRWFLHRLAAMLIVDTVLPPAACLDILGDIVGGSRRSETFKSIELLVTLFAGLRPEVERDDHLKFLRHLDDALAQYVDDGMMNDVSYDIQLGVQAVILRVVTRSLLRQTATASSDRIMDLIQRRSSGLYLLIRAGLLIDVPSTMRNEDIVVEAHAFRHWCVIALQEDLLNLEAKVTSRKLAEIYRPDELAAEYSDSAETILTVCAHTRPATLHAHLHKNKVIGLTQLAIILDDARYPLDPIYGAMYLFDELRGGLVAPRLPAIWIQTLGSNGSRVRATSPFIETLLVRSGELVEGDGPLAHMMHTAANVKFYVEREHGKNRIITFAKIVEKIRAFRIAYATTKHAAKIIF